MIKTNATNGTRNRQRSLALVPGVGLLVATALAACDVGETVDEEDTEAATSDDEILRFAHVYDASHPVETCGVPAIQEHLEGSGINIESYPSAQLGNEAESLEQIANGGLDIAVAGPSFLGVWHEPAAVLDGAYLFDDVDHFIETVNGEEITQIHDDLYEESGIRVMSTWYYGTRHVTSNVPVNSPEDLAGVKLRTPDAPLYLTNIEGMGGTATPMALDEVYTALQQGVLDAQENPVPTIASSGFHEVQDYINLTGHMVQAVHTVTHDGVYDSLDDEQAALLDEAMDEASEAVRECIVSEEEEFIEEWKGSDEIEVVEDVDREAFADAVADHLPDEVPWGDLYLEIRGTP
ncbi:DctP family TRAP transporter solute-binding subunit [Actinobacteria bacterium YIM 96077]|uniref:TRAP transporter substrate-binding protein DctP n=1 Tax=Phytoactinopolyspora halophila TaxID=1981511 RepID=A0A329QDZ2_9ACTN|nr:DctP family TRAP transporter solute-binding subunit [Phytoactinopolyspora halophila]AYY12686.1 DctP family TRAP transporter solute-binding subunit [Actinobacteria bacterium YIM 96077]RAW10600.1 TRAP transporter substrate-binding protein DctP [Phytoactinopolyspora halophila]